MGRELKARPVYLASVLWLLVLFATVGQAIWIVPSDWSHVPAALRPDTSDNYVGFITVLIMSSVGWLVAVRRPRNAIGWLMLAISILGTGITLPQVYAVSVIYRHVKLPAAEWVYWSGQFIWLFLLSGLLVLLPMLFPNGRLLSRRWLIPLAFLGLLDLIGVLASFAPASTTPLHNPVGIAAFSGLLTFINSLPFAIGFVLASTSGMVSLVVRYRRAGEHERQQLKWFLAAVALLVVGLVINIFIPATNNTPIISLTAGFLPIAIGIAVLRHRLYDIDLIINKALVYGSLGVVITAAYVLVVIGIGAFMGSRNQLVLSVITTLLIAVGFQPLRQRTQRLANRLVYGKRSSPYETLSLFSEHLSATFSSEDILDRMSRILGQATGAERAEVWIRTGPRLLLASSSPPLTANNQVELPMANGNLPPMERDQVVPVAHQGELLGALAVIKKRGETMNTVEQKLLADLAAQAGLVLKNVGLNRELMARLDDLRASRQRLVTAQDEERRRIERDLHDGAQQHLVALKVNLALAEAAAEPQSKVRSILTQLKIDADEALTTTRELARGIYPPLLASDGLAVALRAQVRRLPVPVDLEVDGLPRLPREVEAAVYFCCLEALQNIGKYAHATQVRLRLRLERSSLAFTVADNGKGFDLSQARDIHGIENMRDRLEALGGSLRVESRPGAGTRVSGDVPINEQASAATSRLGRGEADDPATERVASPEVGNR